MVKKWQGHELYHSKAEWVAASNYDALEAQFAETQRDFTALQRAIVGDTGASAMLAVIALKARLAELEAERTGTIHESWQHKTHAELLEGLKWQGAITKSLLASNDELQAWLAEAKGLLEEIGDEWPAVKRTTVERAYAFIERPTDSATPRQVGCEREDGLLNIHDEGQTCEVCHDIVTTETVSEVQK